MRRPLEVERGLDGDARLLRRAFRDDPGSWLPAPARWRGRGRWNVRLEGGPLSRVVVCRVGDPWHVGEEWWRLLGWEPVEQPGDALPVERALPAFTGELGVAPSRAGGLLVLRGVYVPPAGPLGAAADAAGLQRLARATGEAFLEAVASRLPGAATAPSGERPPR